MSWKFTLYSLFFMAWACSMAATADPILLGEADMVLVGPQVDFLEDTEGLLDIETVRAADAGKWSASEQNILNFGYTSATYWLRIRVTQAGNSPERHLLEISYPVLDHIQAYIYRDGALQDHFVMGDRLSFSNRPIDHPHFVFPLEAYSQQITEVYLRVQSSSSVQIPMNLWRGDALLEHAYVEALGRALFYGAMLIMASYNLLIFISVRESSYLWYVLHVISITVLLAGVQGVTFKLFWPEATGWNDTVLVVALSGLVSFPCLFVRSFLNLPEARPRLSRLLAALACLGLACAIAAFVLPYRLMIVTTMACIVATILSCFMAGLLRWRDGFHAAKFYLVAWVFLLGGGLVMISNKMGVLPRNWMTENATQLGAGAEVMLLSFALAYRMNYERRMRSQAQRESAEAQRQLLEHQVRANEELDRIVRERTEALEEANEKLTLISSTDALTNVLNRRAFEQLFEQEYKRAYRERSPIGLLMIDLDHFKRINDRYGHQFGDHCLLKAAELLQSCIRRPPDACARYGGEEFVLLLPNTDLEGVVCVAEAIIQRFAATTVSHEDLRLIMSASMGAASLIPNNIAGREQLLKQADEHLYTAKAQGRNKVVWQISEGEVPST